MKFARHNKPFSGPLDAAPFAGVFLVLLIFLALGKNLVFTPGAAVRLPGAADMIGTPNPTAMVAVDVNGQLYFENQVVTEEKLLIRLGEEARQSPKPITLVIQADKDVRYELLIRLGLLVREAGISDAILATRPGLAEQEGIRSRP